MAEKPTAPISTGGNTTRGICNDSKRPTPPPPSRPTPPPQKKK